MVYEGDTFLLSSGLENHRVHRGHREKLHRSVLSVVEKLYTAIPYSRKNSKVSKICYKLNLGSCEKCVGESVIYRIAHVRSSLCVITQRKMLLKNDICYPLN